MQFEGHLFWIGHPKSSLILAGAPEPGARSHLARRQRPRAIKPLAAAGILK
jgi:hypothetical protein